MGRNLFKPFLIIICCFTNSCAFDPPNAKLQEIGGNYYASFDKHSPNDGLKIVYSEDKELFKQVASNCINIYIDSNIVMYSKSLFEGDTTNIEYYTFEINSKSEIKRISKISFEKGISNLEKIRFSKD